MKLSSRLCSRQKKAERYKRERKTKSLLNEQASCTEERRRIETHAVEYIEKLSSSTTSSWSSFGPQKISFIKSWRTSGLQAAADHNNNTKRETHQTSSLPGLLCCLSVGMYIKSPEQPAQRLLLQMDDG